MSSNFQSNYQHWYFFCIYTSFHYCSTILSQVISHLQICGWDCSCSHCISFLHLCQQ